MIASDEVQVWYGSVRSPGMDTWDDLYPLSVEERRRAESFRFEIDRCRYVLGKRMMRNLLAQTLSVSPEAIRFARGPHGKPRVEGNCTLTFNLAHSGDQVVLALAVDREVGVDIEHATDNTDLISIARQYFCEREVRRLEESSCEARRMLFFRYWTLKEAYLKAEGSGLSLSPKIVDVSGIPENSIGPHQPVEDFRRGIYLRSLDSTFDCATAVAAKGDRWRIRTHHWSVQSLSICK